MREIALGSWYWVFVVFLAGLSGAFSLLYPGAAGILVFLALAWGVLMPRPWLLAALTFVALMLEFKSATGISIGSIPITTGKVAVVLWISGWGIARLVNRKPLLYWSPVFSGYIAVLLSMLASILFTGITLDTKISITSYVLLMVMGILGYSSVRKRELLRSLWLMGVFFIFVMLWSLVVGRDLGERALGTFGNANTLAGVAAVFLPVFLGVFLTGGSLVSRFFIILLMTIVPLVIVQTGSRGGLISVILILPLLLYMLRNRPLLVGAGISLGASAALYTILNTSLLGERFSVFQEEDAFVSDFSISFRMAAIRVAWDAFLENPIFGIGVGHFLDRYAEVMPESLYALDGTKTAHNQFALTLAEQGVVGITALFYLVGTHIWRLWNVVVEKTRPEWERSLALAFFGGLLAATFLGVSMEPFGVPLFHLVFGLSAVVIQDPEENPDTIRARRVF